MMAITLDERGNIIDVDNSWELRVGDPCSYKDSDIYPGKLSFPSFVARVVSIRAEGALLNIYNHELKAWYEKCVHFSDIDKISETGISLLNCVEVDRKAVEANKREKVMPDNHDHALSNSTLEETTEELLRKAADTLHVDFEVQDNRTIDELLDIAEGLLTGSIISSKAEVDIDNATSPTKDK
jgi:hypothetical protein